MVDIDESVEHARELLLVAAKRLSEAISKNEVSRDIAADYLKKTVYLLRCYCRPENWENGVPVETIPLVLARNIANDFDYILAGDLPSTLKNVLNCRRRAGRGPHEKRDISCAVAYVKAAKAGLISDNSPIKTVANIYGVQRRTVSSWTSKDFSWVTPFDFSPNIDETNHGEKLSEAMQEAGARYIQLGRGTGALQNRAKKG
jgi:hypothetical protein